MESNIFCKFSFEFPELSFYYIEQCLTDLELFGLQIHCIPILKFAILLADKVIHNKLLTLALQLRFARCICTLGYQPISVEIINKVSTQITVSEQEFNSRYIDLTRMRVTAL
jgi:hypothetical protein